MELSIEGRVAVRSASFLTERGLLTLHFYELEDRLAATAPVFEEILEGDYVVQDLVPPSARRIGTEAEPVELKIDLRNYAYRGRVQLVTARLYQGQTTNFRTPGGGFAPVLTVPGGIG